MPYKIRKKKNLKAKKPIIGMAWYSPEQWELLKVKAVDSKKLDDTYEDWKTNLANAVKKFREEGFQIRKVEIIMDGLIEWCTQNNKPLNGESRSSYTVHQLQEMDARPMVTRKFKDHKSPIPFLDHLEEVYQSQSDPTAIYPYPYDPIRSVIRIPVAIENQLIQLVQAGEKPEAMKIVLNLAGTSMRVAKDYVDSLK